MKLRVWYHDGTLILDRLLTGSDDGYAIGFAKLCDYAADECGCRVDCGLMLDDRGRLVAAGVGLIELVPAATG